MKYLSENLKTIACLLGIFGVLFTVHTYYEKTFAKEMEFQRFVMDYKQGRTTDQLLDVNREIWQIEREFKNKSMDDRTYMRHKYLLEEQKRLQEDLKEYRKRKK